VKEPVSAEVESRSKTPDLVMKEETRTITAERFPGTSFPVEEGVFSESDEKYELADEAGEEPTSLVSIIQDDEGLSSGREKLGVVDGDEEKLTEPDFTILRANTQPIIVSAGDGGSDSISEETKVDATQEPPEDDSPLELIIDWSESVPAIRVLSQSGMDSLSFAPKKEVSVPLPLIKEIGEDRRTMGQGYPIGPYMAVLVSLCVVLGVATYFLAHYFVP